MGPTPKCYFVPGLQSGSPEIPKIGILVPLEAHNFVCKRPIEVRFSPHQELFNGMCHASCTQGNQSDSQLLMVGGQINNLTLGPFFGHNLVLGTQMGHANPF